MPFKMSQSRVPVQERNSQSNCLDLMPTYNYSYLRFARRDIIEIVRYSGNVIYQDFFNVCEFCGKCRMLERTVTKSPSFGNYKEVITHQVKNIHNVVVYPSKTLE
jgi:thiol-disulfide isomerase/thioredoxin